MRSLACSIPAHDDPLEQPVPFTIPAGRLAKNEEIAKLALFFASDHASYCRGAALVADGGLSIV